jgi:branched-chain amino acid transport system substrate-binding protein
MTRQYRVLLLLLIFFPWNFTCQKSEPPFHCTDTLGCVDIQPGKPIKIGVLQSLTGDVAPLGTEQVRGIELAVDAHKGKILGRALVL